uniref:Putative WD40/YVTN repeat-like-containing domain-containing protein n=1 Tax=Helianthus annuus TaxID=4232 RepID=A0A251RVH1_HELAN
MSQIWSSRDFKPVKVLSGHEVKVTSVDVAAAVWCYRFCRWVKYCEFATVSHDKTIKLWSSKNAEKDKAMDMGEEDL